VIVVAYSERIVNLTERELEAVARASTWYANYFAHELASEADQTHAYAVAERESYVALVEALRKLGIRFAIPEEIQPHLEPAA